MKLPAIRPPRHPREIGEFAQLLFEWPINRAPRLALPLCILAAGLIQAAIIVLFSIRYGTPSENIPAQPRFYFLPPGSEIARRITPWLEAHDPSVFSPLRATATAVPSPPPLRYRPSYEDPPPPLRPLAGMEEELSEPPSLPLTALPSTGSPRPEPSATPPPASGTDVRWLDDLASRRLSGDPASVPQGPGRGSPIPHPSLYQVAVGPEGIPRSCVLIEPSGDEEADAAGRIWILGRRFLPAETTSWGRVFVLWGFRPRAASSPAP